MSALGVNHIASRTLHPAHCTLPKRPNLPSASSLTHSQPTDWRRMASECDLLPPLSTPIPNASYVHDSTSANRGGNGVSRPSHPLRYHHPSIIIIMNFPPPTNGTSDRDSPAPHPVHPSNHQHRPIRRTRYSPSPAQPSNPTSPSPTNGLYQKPRLRACLLPGRNRFSHFDLHMHNGSLFPRVFLLPTSPYLLYLRNRCISFT
ncbi:hypothetical protein B0T14DRAFT_95870 [Immersiella caudata]|uniref:Uncharacterized protein n=1 Tax=Immersiella caudata TaxID=314043 RepID=A0AA39X3A6_9PEZI|nr:hypothetical protein B0T14DRAFT_95870 [Immersiella caudata]